MATSMKWQPAWWNDEIDGTAWERVRESMRRDWEQTKHDLGFGGQALNQSAKDTFEQALGKEPVPTGDPPNAILPIDDWNDAAAPYGFGFAARRVFGSKHPRWDAQVEAQLQRDWVAAQGQARRDWADVSVLVQRGYGFTEEPAPGMEDEEPPTLRGARENVGGSA